MRALDQAGLPLRGLSVSRPSLDDVFLRATGETMPAESPDDAADDAGEGATAAERDAATTPEVTS